MEPVKTGFFAMDTLMEITVYGTDEVPPDGEQGKTEYGNRLSDGAQELVKRVEGALSVTDKDSEIFRLNSGQQVMLGETTRDILSKSLGLCGLTGGRLDISIYPLVKLWGFTTGEYTVPAGDRIAAGLENVGYKAVSEAFAAYDGQEQFKLPEGMEIDLGAVAKGYTAELLKEYYTSNGVASGLISLGGNVLAIGTKPDGSNWNIAIADPAGDGYAAILGISDASLVTSGGYERYFEANGKRYSHIIDPATGYPVDNGVLSVSVTGRDSMYCDALSTALFVMGEDEAEDFWRRNRDFEFVIINDEGKIIASPGLKGILEPGERYGKDAVSFIDP